MNSLDPKISFHESISITSLCFIWICALCLSECFALDKQAIIVNVHVCRMKHCIKFTNFCEADSHIETPISLYLSMNEKGTNNICYEIFIRPFEKRHLSMRLSSAISYWWLLLIPFIDSSRTPNKWPGIMYVKDYSILWLRRTVQDRQNRPDSRTHGDSILLLYEVTVRCYYNAVNFLTNIHKRHPIAHRLGRGMGCLLWMQRLINTLSQFLQ